MEGLDSPAIEVRAATKLFGDGAEAIRALDGVSVTIRQREFFTLLGPSGCGKTTLLRLIAGFELLSAGDILLAGHSVAHLPPNRRPVNTVFQSYALFPHMTVAQNIAFGLEMRGLPRAEVKRTVEDMLALVKLTGKDQRRPSQLSGGQQQRVALARALANRPKVLLLDEPLSALDLKLRQEMQIELKKLQLATGLTFIFVTHDQEEALTMSDRIAVMNSGEILQVGTPKEIYERPTRRCVADFIGATNFLEGEIVTLAKEGARVRLRAGAEFVAAAPQGMSVGRRVTVAVRPERVVLSPPGQSEGLIEGSVKSIVYFGTDTLIHLVLAGAEHFVVRLQNRDGAIQRFSEGDACRVAIPAGALQVLSD